MCPLFRKVDQLEGRKKSTLIFKFRQLYDVIKDAKNTGRRFECLLIKVLYETLTAGENKKCPLIKSVR